MAMKRLFFLFFCAAGFAYAPPPPFKQFHRATYRTGWDINFSPFAGGENILFLHRAIERAEGYMI